MTARTPAQAINRVTHDLAHLLTPRARRWIVGWLVGTAARGMPMPGLCGLPADGDSYGPTAWTDSALYAEWDFPVGVHPMRVLGGASLELGPGPGRYLWCNPDLWGSDESYDATITLDGPTTARVVTLLRWLAASS